MRKLQCSATVLDKIFVAVFGGLAIFFSIFFMIDKTFYSDKCVLWITAPNEELIYPMDKPQNIKVKGRIGITEIEIKDGKFTFIDSECPNKQCLNSGWISFPMMPIICLPNGVSAVIKEIKRENTEVDGVAM